MNKFKQQLKNLFLTKEGWISWIIANLITSTPWAIPLAYGFIFQDNRGYIVAGTIWTIFMLPFTPLWVVNILLAYFLLRLIWKKK